MSRFRFTSIVLDKIEGLMTTFNKEDRILVLIYDLTGGSESKRVHRDVIIAEAKRLDILKVSNEAFGRYYDCVMKRAASLKSN